MRTFKYCPETEELEPIKEGDDRELVAKLDYAKLALLSLLIFLGRIIDILKIG